MREVGVLIVHEDVDIADIIASRFENVAMFQSVEYAHTMPDAVEEIYRGLRPKTIIFHKGLGDSTPLEPCVDSIRAIEGGKNIRLGIVSGEFYGGEICKTALALGANFGWDLTDRMRESGSVPDWVVTMTNLGYLYPIELELQGKEIILSELQARDRLKLLNITSAPWFRSPRDTDRF